MRLITAHLIPLDLGIQPAATALPGQGPMLLL